MIKRMKKAIGLAAFGLAGALLLSGCGNESGSGDERNLLVVKNKPIKLESHNMLNILH